MPKQPTPAPARGIALPGWIVRRHERHYRDSAFHLWADVILALILAGLATTLVWLLLWQPQADFTLAARTDSSRITSGKAHDFIIRYSNEEGNLISGVSLALELPEHFELVSVEPATGFDRQARILTIGDLPDKQEGEVVLRGIVRGEIGSQQSLGMNLTYQDGAVKKQVLNSLGYTIDDSALRLSIVAPEKAYVSVLLPLSVTVENAGESAMNSIELVFPDSVWSLSGNGAINNNRLVIDSLPAGSSKTIELSAAVSETGEHEFVIEGSWMIDNISRKQASVAKAFTVVEPGLAVSASIREASLDSAAPSPTVDIEYTNTTDQPLSDVSFSVGGSSGFTIQRLESLSSGFAITGTTLSVPGSLQAGATGKLSLKAVLERDTVATNQVAGVVLTVSYRAGEERSSYTLASRRIKLNSNLSLESAGYYYGPQGDQLGVGPIPPKADIPTTYWIIWQINNLGNDIESPEVTADLPSNVVWYELQSSTSGELTYSPVTKRVLWKPGSVNKTGGNYRISFPVTIVPRQSDIGTVPKLVTNIVIRGKDAFTGTVLERRAGDITTDIPADRQSAGKGKVEPLQ